ncbi:MAG: hypothetical protein EPN91_00050 [Salinibacterium sp.]|nr:MAG: hypothetical protein EPN91_00050 [Salinibacterium sp.]
MALDWTPSTEADLDGMDPLVVELVWELRRGQRQSEQDRTPSETGGRPIAGYDPSTDRAKSTAGT